MSDARKSLGTELRRELITLLDGGKAHATFEAAVKGFPAKLRGVVPEGLPYSAWQIVEHLRIAQRDILDFCDNGDGSYKPMKWPDDYWPKEAAPADDEAWEASLAAIHTDREAFDKLLHNADDAELVQAFPWGDGQSLLHEALLIADHNAYHTGELIVVRRLLGAWRGASNRKIQGHGFRNLCETWLSWRTLRQGFCSPQMGLRRRLRRAAAVLFQV